ncbi:MAG: hypothetical protein QM713_10875 [Arachnia sp.]
MWDDRRPSWRALAGWLAAGALTAAAVVVVARFAYLQVAPLPAVLLGLLIGALVWLTGWFEDTASPPPWHQPQPPAEHARLAADVRTRRLDAMLAHAKPGEGFETTAVTRTLTALAAERLVRRHGLPADDPLPHADGILSPRLLAHLRAERPPALKRPVLHAYLKEIDEL